MSDVFYFNQITSITLPSTLELIASYGLGTGIGKVSFKALLTTVTTNSLPFPTSWMDKPSKALKPFRKTASSRTKAFMS
jgi:hypothetical protein